jgi:hypothetical protein
MFQMNKSEQARCQAHTHHAHKAVHGHLSTLLGDSEENANLSKLCNATAMKKVSQAKKFKLKFYLYGPGPEYIYSIFRI